MASTTEKHLLESVFFPVQLNTRKELRHFNESSVPGMVRLSSVQQYYF